MIKLIKMLFKKKRGFRPAGGQVSFTCTCSTSDNLSIKAGYLLVKDIEHWIDELQTKSFGDEYVIMQDLETGAKFEIKKIQD